MRLAWSALDLRRGRVSSHDAGAVFVSASLIKLPILVAVLDAVDGGRLTLDTPLPILPTQRAAGAGWFGMRTDLTAMDVAGLAGAMIEHSDNTATNTLIDAVGFPAVADAIARRQLTATALRRHMMDAAARARGDENVTTADDMSTLLRALVVGDEYLSSGSRRFAVRTLLRQRTTGRIDAGLPPGLRLAHKTGELDDVRHDAGIVFDGSGAHTVITVLSDGVTDADEADARIAARTRQILHDLAAS